VRVIALSTVGFTSRNLLFSQMVPRWAGSGSEPWGPQPTPWPTAAPGGAGREGGALHTALTKWTIRDWDCGLRPVRVPRVVVVQLRKWLGFRQKRSVYWIGMELSKGPRNGKRAGGPGGPLVAEGHGALENRLPPPAWCTKHVDLIPGVFSCELLCCLSRGDSLCRDI
jgi:hypothetical protein